VATTDEDASVDAVEIADAAAKTAEIPEPPQLDPDGNDDPEDLGHGNAPVQGTWERVGTAPLALTRICDLTPFQGALYAAHANQPLGTDGATITKYAAGSFKVAFDWNRPGEPVKGGGAGQGFLRVHAIDGRLFVPDADPPYGGLQLVDWGTEGYVFSSDEKGIFPAARAPHFKPPVNVGVLPHAYHVLDVIKFRGAYFASTGSVPPKEPAWRGHSPGALHRANADRSRWIYETDYPTPLRDDGVWRLTYMVRFKDRLYAGIQDYDGRDPNDFVYFTPKDTDPIRHEDAHATRITAKGASGTLRWWVDTQSKPHRLYWLAWTKSGIGIWTTTDGDNWKHIEIPPENGVPTDVTRFRDAVVVLTTNGLYRLEKDDSQSLIAPVDLTPTAKEKKPTPSGTTQRGKSPFEITDFFCAAPLAVMDNVLYAGSQRGGSLYRLVETAEPK
jgi:hypothetical protein